MSPFLKSLEDGQKFFIMSVVIKFRGRNDFFFFFWGSELDSQKSRSSESRSCGRISELKSDLESDFESDSDLESELSKSNVAVLFLGKCSAH
jgi:hypothetical protein